MYGNKAKDLFGLWRQDPFETNSPGIFDWALACLLNKQLRKT